jgi:hypothetical protein
LAIRAGIAYKDSEGRENFPQTTKKEERIMELTLNNFSMVYSDEITNRIAYLSNLPEREVNEEEELEWLLKVEAEAKSYNEDYDCGESLINDEYLDVYAAEYASEIFPMDQLSHWPCNCINWVEATEELKKEMGRIDWNGSTFWIRKT